MFNNGANPPIVVLGLIGVLAGLLFGVYSIAGGFTVLILLIGLFLFTNNLKTMVLIVLILRSSLDIVQDWGPSVGSITLNPASFLGEALIYFGLLGILIRKGKFIADPISKVFVLFLGISFLGTIIAFGSPENAIVSSIKEWSRLFSLFVLYSVIVNLFTTEDETRKVRTAVFLSLIIPLSVGYYQLFTGSGMYAIGEDFPRLFGTLVHPNNYSLYLCLFIIQTIVSIGDKGATVNTSLLLLLLLVALMFTYSRTGYFLFFVSVSFIGLIRYRKLFFSMVLLLTMLIVLNPMVYSRFGEIFQQISVVAHSTREEIPYAQGSFPGRVAHWLVLLDLWKTKPVFGYGLATSSFVTPWKTPDGQGIAPHNEFVKYLLELGVIGAVVYIIFLWFVGHWLWRSFSVLKDREHKGTALGLFSIFIGTVIVGFSAGEPMSMTAFQYYFWTLMGLIQNYRRLEERRGTS